LRWVARYLAYLAALGVWIGCALGLHWAIDQIALAATGARIASLLRDAVGPDAGAAGALFLALAILPAALGSLAGLIPFRAIAAFGWPARARWRHLIRGWSGAMVLLWLMLEAVHLGIVTGRHVDLAILVILPSLGFAWCAWVHRLAAPAAMSGPADPEIFT